MNSWSIDGVTCTQSFRLWSLGLTKFVHAPVSLLLHGTNVSFRLRQVSTRQRGRISPSCLQGEQEVQCGGHHIVT
jgi:hypothetical protein